MRKNFLAPKKDRTYSLGYLPPQDIEMEQAVIGTALRSKHDAREALFLLPDPDYFYKEAHQRIWMAIIHCMEGSAIDLLIVTNHLRSQGELEMVGGAHFITSLTTKTSSADNLQSHCHILKQLWIKRELMVVAGQLGQQSADDTQDALLLLEEVRKNLDDIAKGSFMSKEALVGDVSAAVINEAAENLNKDKNNDAIFIPTGIPEFDRKMGGRRKGQPDLVITGGRPGMGKSSGLAWQTASQISAGIPVGIATLEMSKEQLVRRMVIGLSENQMDNNKLQFRAYTKDDYMFFERGGSKLMPTPCPIYDKGGLDVRTLRLLGLQWKEQYDIQLLYVDYLQMLRFGNETNPVIRNGEVSTALKNIAKELSIPVIALASLSRGPDIRSDHMPVISDLRESGTIESDADMVELYYRENYYDKSVDYRDLIISVGKNRHGDTGEIQCVFDVATNRPTNLPLPNIPPHTYFRDFSASSKEADF